MAVLNVPVTLADNSITNAKLSNMAQGTIKGRQAGSGTGDPEDLTPSQARTVLELGTAAQANTTSFDAAGSAAAAQAAAISTASGDATTKANAAQAAAIAASAQRASNLSDLTNAATARTNLGLGTAAQANTGTGAADVPTITQGDARYIPVSTINAKGDLLVGTADNVAGILPVGTDGMSPVADSSTATGQVWGFKELPFVWFRSATTATDLPAAVEWLSGAAVVGLRNTLFDLTHYRQVRLLAFVNTAGFAGSKLIVRYRTAYSATASAYSVLGTSEVACLLTTGGGIWVTSGWIDIVAGARVDDVYIGLMTIDGNGVADPVISQAVMYLR